MPQGQTSVNSLEDMLRERDFILDDLHEIAASTAANEVIY